MPNRMEQDFLSQLNSESTFAITDSASRENYLREAGIHRVQRDSFRRVAILSKKNLALDPSFKYIADISHWETLIIADSESISDEDLVVICDRLYEELLEANGSRNYSIYFLEHDAPINRLSSGLHLTAQNLEEMTDAIRRSARGNNPLEVAIYANDPDDTHRNGHIGEIVRTISQPTGFDSSKDKSTVFGPSSKAIGLSTINDAVDYVTQAPNRILAVAYTSELSISQNRLESEGIKYNSTQRENEILQVLEGIYAANSSVFIRFFQSGTVKHIWPGREIEIPRHHFADSDLKRLILARRMIASDNC